MLLLINTCKPTPIMFVTVPHKHIIYLLQGCLGIVLAVRLRCVRSFQLTLTSYPCDMGRVLHKLQCHLRASRHFRFWYDTCVCMCVLFSHIYTCVCVCVYMCVCVCVWYCYCSMVIDMYASLFLPYLKLYVVIMNIHVHPNTHRWLIYYYYYI